MPSGFMDLIDWSRVKAPPPPSEPICYVIQSGEHGPVKVGYASDIKDRLRALQVAHHSPLRILRTYPGGRDTETQLHALLAPHALRGEWFTADALALLPDA